MALGVGTMRRTSSTPAVPYTTRIIKAGALLADTKTLFAHWDAKLSTKENLDSFRRQNVFGKTSRSRIRDIVAIFRQRYLGDDSVARALAVLVKQRLPSTSLNPILFYHAAKADRLLGDTVNEILTPMLARGVTDINVAEVERMLRRWSDEGKTSSEWSEPTARRVTQGVLSTLRDFGVLKGAVNKQIAPASLAISAFAYLTFYLKQHQPSGAKLIAHPDWKLFFLPQEAVERLLLEAHQRHLLEYHAAGSVTRLTFPVSTLEEYAHVVAQSAH